MSMTPPAYETPAVPQKRSNAALIIVLILAGFGLACIVLIAVGAAVLLPAFAQARRSAQRTAALSNMRSLAIGNLIYATDHDQRLPIATSWMDEVTPNVPNPRVFHSPGLD